MAMGALISACDSTEATNGDFETNEVQDLYTVVVSELDMSSEQQAQFSRALAQHDHSDREPGYLWIVADSLADTLSDEQKQALFYRTDAYEGFHPFRGLRGTPGGGGYYGFGGLRGAMGRHGESGADSAIDLTEEQQDAIKTVHEGLREQLRGLKDAHDAGELSNGEFVNALVNLHDQRKDAIDDILTDEQKDALEDYRAEREADFEAFREQVLDVRDDVLGLTQEESDAYNAIFQDQLDLREVLMEQFESGELTLSQLREEVESMRAATIDALQALLTEEQFEVVQIHAALVIRVGMRGHFRRHDRQ